MWFGKPSGCVIGLRSKGGLEEVCDVNPEMWLIPGNPKVFENCVSCSPDGNTGTMYGQHSWCVFG